MGLKNNKKTIFNSIVGFITKNGKEYLSSFLFRNALSKAGKKINLGCQFLLVKIFKKLQSAIEVKEIKCRKKFFKIPFFIKQKRQRYLNIKWFFIAVGLNKSSTSFMNKMLIELVSVIKFNTSKANLLKIQNAKLAFVNRSNIHYRW